METPARRPQGAGAFDVSGAEAAGFEEYWWTTPAKRSGDSQDAVPILAVNRTATSTSSPQAASIVIGRYQGTVVVTVHGELDLAKAAHLGATLTDLIDGQGNLSVVVDLHGATAKDADCLWVFTQAAERARLRGGTITLSDPPGSIDAALQLRGLDNFVRRFIENGLSGGPAASDGGREGRTSTPDLELENRPPGRDASR